MIDPNFIHLDCSQCSHAPTHKQVVNLMTTTTLNLWRETWKLKPFRGQTFALMRGGQNIRIHSKQTLLMYMPYVTRRKMLSEHQTEIHFVLTHCLIFFSPFWKFINVNISTKGRKMKNINSNSIMYYTKNILDLVLHSSWYWPRFLLVAKCEGIFLKVQWWFTFRGNKQRMSRGWIEEPTSSSWSWRNHHFPLQLWMIVAHKWLPSIRQKKSSIQNWPWEFLTSVANCTNCWKNCFRTTLVV